MPAHLSDIVRDLAAREPERRVFTFLHPQRDDQPITAGDLHRDAVAIAAILHAEGVRPGDILPLVFDHSYELVAAFWGAMYCGAIPTILPYLSRESRSQAYLEQVCRLARFAQAATVLTSAGFRTFLQEGLLDAGCRVVALPAFPLPAAGAESPPTFTRSEPPYIQFSSGTTGAPKGVVLSSAALLHYLAVSVTDLEVSANDVTVGWLPLYHDMGLLTQILQPLFLPHHSVVMSPADWLREPHSLFAAVHRFRGTITWMPNFAFRYSSRRIRDGQIIGLDLSSWRLLGNASEPVLLEDFDAFHARFAEYGLRRDALTVSFGMAEHVAAVTWTPHATAPDVDWVSNAALEEGRAVPAEGRAPGSRPLVSCGYPLPTVALRIVDGAGRELAEREVGEVLVHSPCVFKGYHLMPEESVARDGWIHTGDLGYLADGQLYVCGRKKDLIIVGGRNIHPHHLEAVAAGVLGQHCRFAAAFGVPNPQLGTEMPVIVCEMRQLPDSDTQARLQHAIREQVRQSLQLFIGDVLLVEPGSVLKTTSGKINRTANRAKYLAETAARRDTGSSTTLPPSTERRLIAIWEGLFKQAPIGVDDDFFALGGDSLLAVELALEIEEQFARPLPSTALLEWPTISALARFLETPAYELPRPTLIPLRPIRDAGRRPVFYCVHGVGGGVLDYRPLAQAMGPEQPFYALRANGLDGVTPIDDSIEAMAAQYIRAIKEFQPHGPYHLGGYCFGGIVAYEMARQLTTAADEVALVAILEGYAPDQSGHGLWHEWRFALNFLRTLPYWLRDYLQLGRVQLRARNRRLARIGKKRLLRLMGATVDLRVEDMLDHVSSKPARHQRVLESHLTAVRHYAPTPYAGRLVLFRTAQRLLQAPQRDMGWGRLSTTPVDVHMIGGAHATILREPHVRVLADKLASLLLAAPSNPPPGALPPAA